jgi:hypothetical protein
MCVKKATLVVQNVRRRRAKIQHTDNVNDINVYAAITRLCYNSSMAQPRNASM